MLIGEVVKQSGVTRDTVRHYETQGLIPTPTRRENNYKDYAPDTIARIRFIQTMQEAGFTLRQTRSFLDLNDRGAATCGNTREHVQEHIHQLNEKIEQLTAMRTRLEEIFRTCKGNTPNDWCTPVVDSLSGGDLQ